MFSRLSAIAHLLILQAAGIVFMLIIVQIGMNFTGRGKYIDPDRRDSDRFVQADSPVAYWVRERGWLLLMVPVGLTIYHLRQSDPSRKTPVHPSRFVVVMSVLSVSLLVFGLWAIYQSFTPSAGGLHRRL